MSLTVIPNEDPRLHTVCSSIDDGVDIKSVYKDTIEEMFSLMKEHNGIGLSAPQVGITERFFILEYGGIKYTCFNPEIVGELPEYETESEGCLSYPGEFLYIRRKKTIKVKYTRLDGGIKIHRMKDMIARAFQHELDHLNGIVFHDRTD